MTFWQDAELVPRRPSRRRGRRARRRRRAVAIAMIAVALLTLWAIRRGPGGAGAETLRSPSRRAGVPARWRAVPSRWTHTLADEPQELLADATGAVVLGSRTVTALAPDGVERWHVPVERPKPWGAVSADTVLVSTGGGFVALDRLSGATRWSAPTAETPGAVALVAPPGTAPVAVVTTDEGGFVGLDAATGARRWSLRVPGRPRGVPAVDDASGSVALVTGGAETRLRVFDGRTGAPRWDRVVAAQTSAPLVAGGAVVLGAGDGRYHSAVTARALADGSARWTRRTPASFQPGLRPTLAGGSIYVLDQLDHLTRIDLGHGRRVWTRALRGAALVGAPVVVGDAVLVSDATRAVLTVDRVTGRVRKRWTATGVPVRVTTVGPVSDRLVLLAQRLVDRDHIAAYPAVRVGAVRARSARGAG